MKIAYPRLFILSVFLFFCSLGGYAQEFIAPTQYEAYIPIPQVASEKDYVAQKSLGGAEVETWTYEIPWSWDRVREYFKNKMPDYGWTDISRPGVATGSFFGQNSVMFQKGNKTVMITNIPLPSQGVTTFSVNLNEQSVPLGTGDRPVFDPSGKGSDMPDLPTIDSSGPIDPTQGIEAFFDSISFTDEVSDVPVYPGASQIIAKQQGERVTASFTSSANKESIISFYKNNMRQNRWSLEYEGDFQDVKKGMVNNPFLGGGDKECPTCPETPDLGAIFDNIKAYTMKFQKGGKQCAVNLMSLGAAGTTMININYVEADE